MLRSRRSFSNDIFYSFLHGSGMDDSYLIKWMNLFPLVSITILHHTISGRTSMIFYRSTYLFCEEVWIQYICFRFIISKTHNRNHDKVAIEFPKTFIIFWRNYVNKLNSRSLFVSFSNESLKRPTAGTCRGFDSQI